MKVFLSWSGQESQHAAEAFQDWLPFVLNAIVPWMSATDIDAGARWSASIQAELEETRFGILFVRRSNTNASWLLFEAGALAKSIDDTYVCPFLLNMKPTDLPGGPLSQFQAKIADKTGTWELVQTINKALNKESISENRLEKAFQKWWPDLEQKLSTIEATSSKQPEQRMPDEMIEEILTIVRRIDRKETPELPESEASLENSIFRLSALEIGIVQQLISGRSTREIALETNRSVESVKSIVRKIMYRVDAKNIESLKARAIELGIVPL